MEAYNKLTDDKLVALFCTGQNEAFDELLLRYKEKLYTYISYIVKNEDLADDLFQETFVKAIVSLRNGRYTENGHFYFWLTRIAHNLIINVFRSEKNVHLIYEDEEESNWKESERMQMIDSFDNEPKDEQVLENVKHLMNGLPENQREIMFMRFYQDMSFKEIADTKGVSINTALGRARYAILNMRKMAKTQEFALWDE